MEARFVNLKAQTLEAIQLLPQAPPDLLAAIQSIEGPSALTDLAVAYMDVKPEEKQEILETLDISARMDKVSRLLAHRIEVLRLSQEIGRQTKAALDEAAFQSSNDASEIGVVAREHDDRRLETVPAQDAHGFAAVSICPALAACTPLLPFSAATASYSSYSESCSVSAPRSSGSSSIMRILRVFGINFDLHSHSHRRDNSPFNA